MTGNTPRERAAEVVIECLPRKYRARRRVVAGTSFDLDVRIKAMRSVNHRLEVSRKLTEVVPSPGRRSTLGSPESTREGPRARLYPAKVIDQKLWSAMPVYVCERSVGCRHVFLRT